MVVTAPARTDRGTERGTERGLRARVRRLVTDPRFERTILAIIVVNAVALGLETTPLGQGRYAEPLAAADRVFIAVFVVELLLKAVAFGRSLFRDPWYVFDVIVVGIALVPATGPLAVLRALRVLRVLRLVSSLPALRRVVNALLASVPGLMTIAALLVLVFYVGAVIATQLFGEAFPEWFGNIGRSMYSLFQIMTLESWSMGIVRPVMAEYPYAWVFFVPFILVTSLTVLNLFIAVIVDSMTNLRGQEAELAAALAARAEPDGSPLQDDLAALRARLAEVLARGEAVVADLNQLHAELERHTGDSGPRERTDA
jgi:voltage-gated sodium channel